MSDRRRECIDLALALIIGATGLSGAIESAAAQGVPQRGGVLNVGFPSDSKTLDPTFSVQFTERQVLYTIYNTLVRYAPDFSIEPELAESWKIEDDGKRIV